MMAHCIFPHQSIPGQLCVQVWNCVSFHVSCTIAGHHIEPLPRHGSCNSSFTLAWNGSRSVIYIQCS